MQSMVKSILTVIFLLIIVGVTGDYSCAYTDSDDPLAVEAAETAVSKLGPERGAIPILSTSRDIIGLESTVSARDAQIDHLLKDLGARKVGTEIQVSLSGDVLFDFDKWDIRKEAEDTLHKLTKLIKELNKHRILIEGHTDSKGSESYNLELSLKRSESVRNWFLSKGNLKEVDIVVKGYGESKPVAPNTKVDGSDNPEGRAKNRRVEIRIQG